MASFYWGKGMCLWRPKGIEVMLHNMGATIQTM